MNPKVGIILVNYNGYEDTIECIESLYDLNYKNYEIILIDNNSNEDREKLEGITDITFIALKDNVGFGVANNIGASIALEHECEYILCLNNDTVVTSDFLNNIVKHANPKVILTGKINFFDDPDCIWYAGGEVSRILGNFRHKNYLETKEISFICGCCLFLSASCYKEIGLFDDNYFMYYEDSDFSLKAIMNNYKLYYISDALIYHKVGKSAKKESGLMDYYTTRNRLYIINKYKDYFGFTASIYFFVSRILLILKYKVKGRDISFILEGIQDYKQGKMGRKNLKI